jgi:hypothetical protein
MSRLRLAAWLCIGAAPPVSGPPTAWPTNKFVRWQPEWGNRTIDVSGVHMRVQLKHCGTDRPSSE